MRSIQFGARGWVRVNGLDEGVFVYAHTVEQQGRRFIGQLIVTAYPWPFELREATPPEDGFGVTSATLKALPIGWIESVINTPRALRELAERAEGDWTKDPAVLAVADLGAEFMAGDQPYVTDEAPKLTRPDGKDPDAFYRRVAEAYAAAVSRSRTVAPALAEDAGVPVATVHRWIAEARRRGFLPPARKGRAG